jgi:hypothetical protein
LRRCVVEKANNKNRSQRWMLKPADTHHFLPKPNCLS